MNLLKYLWLFIVVFLVSILFRVFVAEIVAVPSSSMRDTIFSGDKLVVNKLSYGSALPRSPYEIPWINIFLYLFYPKGHDLKAKWWDYHRLIGYSLFEHGDIMVFNHPSDHTLFVKRCIALPGDTLEIRQGKIFINGMQQEDPNTLKGRYRIWYNNLNQLSEDLDGLDITFQINDDSSSLNAFLTTADLERLTDNPSLDSIARRLIIVDSTRNFEPNRLWSEDFFGPYVVPKKGMTIPIDSNSYKLYANVIQREVSSETDIDVKGMINLEKIVHYTFKKDYFFMIGDNRYDSNDSRYWGPVPEENIVGKASMVLFSNGPEGIRWNRFFHSLN